MAADLPNMTLADEVSHFVEQCALLADKPVTFETAQKLRALQQEEVRIRKALDAAKADEKRPHLDANAEIEARYKPQLSKLADAVKAVSRALTAFMEAEERRHNEERRAAQQKAREEAERAAALAREAESKANPFDRFEAKQEAQQVEAAATTFASMAREPVKVNVASADGGRAAGLKTVGYDIDVIDAAALVLHYATRADVIEAARKCAAAEARASKGEAQIPGVKISPVQKAA